MRHNIMVDVNYYSRKIWNLANGFYIQPSNQTIPQATTQLQDKLA